VLTHLERRAESGRNSEPSPVRTRGLLALSTLPDRHRPASPAICEQQPVPTPQESSKLARFDRSAGGPVQLAPTPPRPPWIEGSAVRPARLGAAEGLLGELLSGWLGRSASAVPSGVPLPLREGLLLTTHQIRAVRCLPATGLTMREFARALQVSPGSATALADRLVQAGAAERHSEREDRRIVRLLPTTAGVGTVTAYQGAQDAVVASVLAVMPASSHAALMSAMDYLVAALGERAPVPGANQDFSQPVKRPSWPRPAPDRMGEE